MDNKDTPLPEPPKDATIGPVFPDATNVPPSVDPTAVPFGPDATAAFPPVRERNPLEGISEEKRKEAFGEASKATGHTFDAEQEEMRQATFRLGDSSRGIDERIADAKKSGLTKDQVQQHLEDIEESPEKIKAILNGLPDEDPLDKQIDDDTQSGLTDQDKADFKQTRKDAQAMVEEAKQLASLKAKNGKLTPDEEARLTAVIEKSDGLGLTWGERFKKTGEIAGKGLVWTLLITLIAYIYLIKLYAGAAASKK